MIDNPIIFYTASLLILTFAVLSMLNKNVIYSLICAVFVFFSAGIFFYILGSEYNAIIQAAVYGFAVPIIIGISIMFITWEKTERKNFLLPMLGVISAVFFILLFADIIIVSGLDIPYSFHLMELQQPNDYSVISEFARGIFIDYVWAFEMFSLVLTIVVAGFTIFKKRGSKV